MFMALTLCLTLLPAPALADELGPVDGTSTVETAGADAEAEAKAKADAEAAAAVQAMIGELPSLGELKGMDSDTLNEAYMAVQSAYDAYETLSEEQQAQVTGADRFEELFGWFNSQVAPLENSGNIYPDVVDANGGITAGTSFSRNGPVLTENDKNLSGKYYIVQSDMTINGNLTVDGSKDGGLVLCQGATLTVNGALIHSGGNAFYIYGQSNNGANVGELIINNSNGDGAAIRSESGSAPRLGISSGKVTINGGSSKKLVDNVELYSTKPIHEGVLDGEAKSPSEWGASSISGGELVLDYCEHHNAVYKPFGDAQHIKSCKQCGFNTGSSTLKADCGTDGYERYVSVGETGHRQECPCGNKFGDVIPHTVETVPTHSKEHHVSGCRECDYTKGASQDHNWDKTTGKCKGCGFKPIAQGTWLSIHDSLQEAMDEASEITGAEALVTLYSEASGNTAIDDEFEFNYPGKTITLDMAGLSLEHQGNPIITVEAGTLIVKGTATITKKADSPEQVNSAIVVKGGELIFEDTLNVTGSAQNLSAAPAILVNGGTVTFEKDVTATAAENEGSSTLTTPAIAPAVKVTDGKLIFNGKLTATGGLGGVPKNTRPCEPAVYAEGGELEFNGDLDLNGGLTITGRAELTKGLTQGAFKVDYGSQTVNGKQLSVQGSSYAKVSDLLAEGYACVKTDSLAEGKEKEYANTRAYTCSDNVTIVKHEHEWKLDSQYPHLHSCACGKSENHEYDSTTGKCSICQSECPHSTVSNGSGGQESVWTCSDCGKQMLVESTASDGTKTYGTDFKAAMKAAENGTTVKLLADIKWGVTPKDRAAITGDGKIVTLNLNGHTITGGWIDIGDNNNPTSCTLKIIGEGGHESLEGMGGYSDVSPKATLDLSEWEGGTISAINISDSSNYEAATREAAVIVGPKAGTIGKLAFGNNQLDKLKKTKLSGGSFNQIWAANHKPVKLGELLEEGYAYQYTDGEHKGQFVEYTKTLQNGSIDNVKVVKCLHSNMKPDETGTATCEYCGKSGKFVASVDGNLYTDMNEAISYWLENGGTLKLYTDYTAADGTWRIVSGSHTINLNGHRMSVKDDSAFKPTNNMHLTVTDGTERGQITNILLDGNQGGSFTLESGYVGNLKMTGDAVVTLKGGSVDNLDVQNCSASTNLSIQGGSIGELNIKDWADGMHISATGGSLGAYDLPSGKILADVLDHQYYAKGTSLDRQVDTAQKPEKFVIKQAPHDFGSTSKAAKVPINGRIPFMVDSPSGNVGVYEVKWYRRTDSGAEHMTENKVADVNVNDTLDVFCVITGLDRPGGAMQWQVAVKDYTINVVPANLSQGAVVFKQVGESMTGLNLMGNIRDGKGTFVFTPWGGDVNNASTLTYCFEVSHDGQKLIEGKDYTIESGNTAQYAGDHTLTIQGIGSYTGTATHTWRIEPYKLTRGNYRPPTITKVYDGTTGFDFSKAGNWGIFTENVAHRPNDEKTGKNPVLGSDGSAISIYLKPEDFKASAVTLDSPDAGDRTASFTIELKTRDGQREPNFVFEAGGSPTIQVTAPAYITKAFLSSSPKAGKLNVANDHAGVYTLDLSALLPTLESPMEYGAVTYEISEIKLDGRYYTNGARVEDGKLILPIQAVETSTESNIGTVKVMVTSGNIVDFPLLINVDATNKIVPTGAPTLSTKTLTYGQALSAIKLSGKLHDNVNNKDVEGTFTWVDGTFKPNAGSYEAAWKFTPAAGDTYTEADGTVTITINKATPTGTPKYTAITKAGQTLADANLTAEDEKQESLFKALGTAIQGIVKWVESEDKTIELDAGTKVEQGKVYTWLFTPNETANYSTLSGTIVLWAKPSSGGGGGVVTPAPTPDDSDVITVKEDTKDNTTSKPGAENDTTITTKTTVKHTTTETTKNEQGQDVSKTTASVSKDLGDKLLDQAVSNKSNMIEITVKSSDANNNGGTGASAADSVKATEVELPKATVNAIAKDTNADLVIKTDNGEVVLDNKTLETIAGAAKGDTVTIVVGENTQLKETQKPAEKIVGKNGTLFELVAKIGEKHLHQFEGGKAYVTLPMPDKLKGKDVLVLYIDDNGLCKILNHSVEKIGAEYYIRFTTTHFSTFAVVDKDEAEGLIKEQNAAHVKELMQSAKFKVTTTKTSKKSVKVQVAAKSSKTMISDIKSLGYTVKYQFYRSTKKDAGYKLLKTSSKNSFISTKGKKGRKYYYKARVLVYDGSELVAKSALKQCSYGARK